MNLKSGWNMKSIMVPAAVAAVTAAVMAGAPALAQSPAHRAAPAAATPIIKSGFKNGPVTVTGSTLKTVASMSLGAGSWAIFAKAFLHGGTKPSVVLCQLTAGADFDPADAALETGPGSAFEQTIALNVVHKFSTAGSVTLACKSPGTTVSVNYIKITAIQAGTLTNVRLP
jgi:hypothetical protein